MKFNQLSDELSLQSASTMPCSTDVFNFLNNGPSGDGKLIHLKLTQGFKPGMMLNVVVSTKIRTRFDIKDCDGNILMHMNPRIDTNVVVFNSRDLRDWDYNLEERPLRIPIQEDVKYNLLISYESNGYRIFINDQEYHFFKHRNNNPPAIFEITYGHVYSITYGLKNSNRVPRQTNEQVRNFENDYSNPHEVQLLGPSTNFWVEIDATVKYSAHRLDINLLNSSGDIIFHFNPRFAEDCVVRNTCFQNSGWGDEERFGGLPFNKNDNFVLRIVAGTDCYITYVNGIEFIRYNHRAPLSSVNKLEIYSGDDLKLHKVSYQK